MREPPVKKVLYWCEECNVPLVAKTCACKREGKRIELLQPYDVRPALAADMALIRRLVTGRFGDVPLKKILLLNKTGGADRADLVIMNGERFGWLSFDPVGRAFSFDIAPEALPFLIGHATKGIVDLDRETDIRNDGGRVGGKRLALKTPVPDGTVIVKYRNRYGTGSVRDGTVKVKELVPVTPRTLPDPGWDVAVERNKYHLKNLERNAVRLVKQHLHDRPVANVSFSGGKDSTAVLHIARKAGVTKAFFIDTGIEFPETVEFVRSQGVEIIGKGGDFWQAAEKAGPPGKDNRWCCKLLKLHPLRRYLAGTGPCVTVQGNRWYESWNRAGLDETSQNPANPLQLNISPIRNWRALEVFLYLWWQKIPLNPLYDKGLERIGCYLCPAMLESEYEDLKKIEPAAAGRWTAFLEAWGARHGYPEAYSSWGLWRWRALPPKMRELCRQHGVAVSDDHTLTAGRPRAVKATAVKATVDMKEERTMKPAMEQQAGGLLDTGAVRKDFPILGDIIYLDNAATSFSPEPVIQAINEFEHSYRANVGRGVHRLTRIATQRYWHAHEKVEKFIGAKGGVTVFTKNTTEAINMVAAGLPWKSGDRIITTILEHHSNLLPWRNLKERGVEVDVIGIHPDFSLDLAALEAAITPETRLVAVTHASNVLGVVTPVEAIARICRDRGIRLLVDGAQSVPHMPVDISRIGCDFFACSGHKMLGPTGTGVLWMKEPCIRPFILGGGMVESVTADGYTAADGYQQYEAGTPNIAGGIGLGAAADYLAGLGMEKVRAHEEQLTARLVSGLKKIQSVHVYAAEPPVERIGVVSFTVDGFHPHEVAQQLDESADILVRSGHHCCQPLMERLGLHEGTVRASLALYNTEEEVDMLVATLEEITR
ncbi:MULTISPECIES: aminotransferase class V-fold PLP-dependent enzyme [unclassified Methanoregula]|uniref:aminotransferase class V-fold PLP-dependent enzyme n=1 Tax=unclassified Methanoregula TaxID=2649730 RepID=UPI0025E56B08|nr:MULTISPECIES: aminotransferase class V-fold PLP-dependent enzyme [unclassified Methanoregula]